MEEEGRALLCLHNSWPLRPWRTGSTARPFHFWAVEERGGGSPSWPSVRNLLIHHCCDLHEVIDNGVFEGEEVGG